MTQILKRQQIFKLISVVLPLLVIILLEIILSAFHYGYSTRLFNDDPAQPGIVNTNPQISKLFFSNKRDVRLGIPQSFKKQKTPDTFRIFVIGESTAYGYPYTPRASFPRMLQSRLAETFTDRNIEIINLSVTAINSIAFVRFADEIADMDADAVLIYAGHNEYYGAMGAGSSQSNILRNKSSEVLIYLKRFKVTQLILNLSGSVKSILTKSALKKDEGFMHRMAGKQEIVLGTDVYKLGIDQFDSNMSELLSRLNDNQIPVFFSNLVSNERGQKPFTSVLNKTTDTTRFYNELRKGEKALKDSLYDESISYFSAANLIDSGYALTQYLKAEAFYLKHDYASANSYFSKAKEEDALRFRAPEAINTIIGDLCKKNANTHFVDARKIFIDHSSNGILDNSLFLDHLHPNLFGNFLLADGFYNKIIETGLIGKQTQVISFVESWKNLPVTDIDSLYGEWMNAIMKEQWPFYENVSLNPDLITTYPGKLTLRIFFNQYSMDTAIDSLYSYFVKRNFMNEALKAAKSQYFDHPTDWRFAARVAELYEKQLNFKQSVYYYKKSFKLFPNVNDARKIVFGLLQLDKPEDMKCYLQYLIGLQPDDRMTIFLLKQTDEVLILKKQFLSNPEDKNVVFGLAEYYLFTRNAEELKKFIDKALAKYPDDMRTSKLQEEYNKLKDVSTIGVKYKIAYTR